jgi:hypothetical protein
MIMIFFVRVLMLCTLLMLCNFSACPVWIYTLKVTSKTLYSPQYITSKTHTKNHTVNFKEVELTPKCYSLIKNADRNKTFEVD